jgi:hypothetical protein
VNGSNISLAYATSAPLALTAGGRDDLGFALADGMPGLFQSASAGTPYRLGGIAVGADALYYELGSDVIALFDDYHTLPFDFPVLAIAHHPNPLSAATAVAWLAALAAPVKQLTMCVGGSNIVFTVVDATAMGLTGVAASDSQEHPLSLAIAQVTLGGEAYVIARAFRAEVTDESPEVPVYLSAAWGRNDEYRLAVWPNGTVATQP